MRGFGRVGDEGVVAERGGEAVGAAWVRLLPGGYGFIAEDVPELSLAVRADAWRQGVATALLACLLSKVPRVSLSVEPDNPALGLYGRFGFTKVGEVEGSWTMLRDPLTGS